METKAVNKRKNPENIFIKLQIWKTNKFIKWIIISLTHGEQNTDCAFTRVQHPLLLHACFPTAWAQAAPSPALRRAMVSKYLERFRKESGPRPGCSRQRLSPDWQIKAARRSLRRGDLRTRGRLNGVLTVGASFSFQTVQRRGQRDVEGGEKKTSAEFVCDDANGARRRREWPGLPSRVIKHGFILIGSDGSYAWEEPPTGLDSVDFFRDIDAERELRVVFHQCFKCLSWCQCSEKLKRCWIFHSTNGCVPNFLTNHSCFLMAIEGSPLSPKH